MPLYELLKLIDENQKIKIIFWTNKLGVDYYNIDLENSLRQIFYIGNLNDLNYYKIREYLDNKVIRIDSVNSTIQIFI